MLRERPETRVALRQLVCVKAYAYGQKNVTIFAYYLVIFRKWVYLLGFSAQLLV